MKEVKANNHKLYMGNKTYCDVLGIGTIKFGFPRENNLILTDVVYVPNMRRNLLSVPCLDEKGFEVHFHSSEVSIENYGRILVWSSKVDGLYRLNVANSNSKMKNPSSAYIDDPCMFDVSFDELDGECNSPWSKEENGPRAARNNNILVDVFIYGCETEKFSHLLSMFQPLAWWVDSASSRHVAKTRDVFVKMKEVKADNHKLYMGNKTYCDVLGIGTIKFGFPGENNLILTDVVYVPNMRRNLLSVPCLDEKGFEVHFHSSEVSIENYGRILVWSSKVDGLYRLNVANSNSKMKNPSSAYIDDPCMFDVSFDVLVMGRPRKHPRGTLMDGDIDGVGGAHNNASLSRSTQSTSQVCGQPEEQSRGSTVPATTTSNDSTSGSSRKGRGTSHLPPRWNTGERYEVSLNDLGQIIGNIKAMFGKMFSHVKTVHYNPHKDSPEYLAMVPDDRLEPMQWRQLVDYWTREDVCADGHGRIRRMGKGVTPTPFNGRSPTHSTPHIEEITTQVKDQLRAEVIDDVREELRVEMQTEFAQVESKMKKQMEFLLTLLDPSVLQSFRATFNDSTSGVGSVHGAQCIRGSRVYFSWNTTTQLKRFSIKKALLHATFDEDELNF
ncbi:hypothetical protein BUALT_Bualt06G0100200 [Buddleja alternifolia]|uniref:Retrovirus-related Pol polyprotein from transposon TNT 1-94-like beta-barrel domain-containing protein n=1 Tax=Buddleja alternifolia TaxID=168488 RepID=A0AAV6XL05_9LAMI|nr:hypothetical protein BUALT_Bualt06G0100200 [Buddleja alternifolia]